MVYNFFNISKKNSEYFQNNNKFSYQKCTVDIQIQASRRARTFLSLVSWKTEKKIEFSTFDFSFQFSPLSLSHILSP